MQKIETQRIELEANIAKLRKSLHHWTTLELDYEGLKDEFQMLGSSATKSECLKAALDFGPQKVDEKELNDLIEPPRGKLRSPAQLVDLLSKRVGYVLRNAESLKTQISDLEKKRNAVLLAAHPEHEAEAILPLAEITEELDDNDDVISSSVQQQGDTAKKVLDVLETSKVRPAEASLTKDPSDISHPRVEEADSSDDDDDDSTSTEAEITGTDGNASSRTAQFPLNPDDTEEEAQIRQEMLNYGLGEVGNIVAELELADADAGASEDGDEDMEDDLDGEEDEEEDDSDESMDRESEDESGRSKATVHTEKYRNRMEELQRQLGLQMENVGPSPETNPVTGIKEQMELLPGSRFREHIDHLPPEFRKRFDRPSAAEAARKAAIAREKAASSATGDHNGVEERRSEKKTKGRKVSFAPTVDVAPDSSSTEPSVMGDTIIENSTASSRRTGSNSQVKASRFKAARSSQPQTPLYPPPMEFPQIKQDDRTGPVGRTVAQTLVERPGTLSAEDAPPPDDDDFDEELQKRQIALENHRLRNRMVHEQGGYVKGGEAENWGDAYAVPKMEDEKTGQPVKISRFKAARLRP